MANEIILLLLTAAYVVLLISCVAEHIYRTEKKQKVVSLPSAMFWVGAIAGMVFLIFAWLAAKQDGSLGLTLCFGSFVLLSMTLMLGWKNCYVTYNGSGFTQKTFIGRHRSFTYNQVTAWGSNSRNPMESSIYVNRKKISFNLLSKNGTDFLFTVSAKYRKTHNNQSIPELPSHNQERGGFCAHVLNPGEYLFIFIMMLVFLAGSCIWLVVDAWQPINEDDAERYVVTFSSWEIDETALVLTTPQMQESFHLDGYENHLSEFKRLTERCDGTASFTVWAKRITPDNSAPYYRVYALSSDGEVYRSFQDSTAHNRDNIPYILGIFGILLGFFLGFSALIYAVGRNPQRFPKWVVYCCFKKDAIYF